MANDGSFLEKLVQIIEQSIAPDAVVERNVKLPILSSNSGATAQCDIVIRTGKPPRETITIVEVQDRESPTTIGDFRNWQKKLEQVGAQHLYCVSRKPFPKSIKEQTALTGHTIKLITLRQLNIDQIPLDFLKMHFVYIDIDVPYAQAKSFWFPSVRGDNHKATREAITRELDQLKTNDLKLSFCPPNLIALSAICLKHAAKQVDLLSKTNTLRVGFEKPLFFRSSSGEFMPVQLEVEFIATSKLKEIPHTILSYDQNDFGALAWVLESFYHSSRGPIWMKMPVTRSEDRFIISGLLVNIPEDMDFNFQLEKRTAQKVERWKAVTKDK
jgi:hypothetical protein